MSYAIPRADHVRMAEGKKTKFYLKDGIFVGGDRAIESVIVKDIRRASNAGFDRIVVDLEGLSKGEPAAFNRPPYYQVAVSPDERRMVFTVFGQPKILFDAKKVIQVLKKSPAIQSVELLPKIEDDSWTFVLGFKTGRPVEVFELSNPTRIIIDVKTEG